MSTLLCMKPKHYTVQHCIRARERVPRINLPPSDLNSDEHSSVHEVRTLYRSTLQLASLICSRLLKVIRLIVNWNIQIHNKVPRIQVQHFHLKIIASIYKDSSAVPVEQKMFYDPMYNLILLCNYSFLIISIIFGCSIRRVVKKQFWAASDSTISVNISSYASQTLHFTFYVSKVTFKV